MKRFNRVCCGVLSALMLAGTAAPALAAEEQTSLKSGEYQTTVLFTQDMHEHLLPAKREDGSSYGGFGRLSAALNAEREKWPDALTVDAGDFSMGSLFQFLYAEEAPELRLMGQMGYDAVTLGNHEFDYRAQGLADMLLAAKNSGDPLPALVDANYLPDEPGAEGYTEGDKAVRAALDEYGASDYTTFSRGGITYAVFGIFGNDADECAPMSGMQLEDPVETAKQTVEKIHREVQTEEPIFVICLSHSGMSETNGAEDRLLAEKVEGIDLIISGHSHLIMAQPELIGNTLIVSGGSYTEYLGEVVVCWNGDGTITDYDYTLLELEDGAPSDPGIDQQVAAYQKQVEEEYLSRYGFTGFDQVLTDNKVPFGTIEEMYENHGEAAYGCVVTDAFRDAYTKATGETADFALTAVGVIRDTLPMGPVTVSDAFNSNSLGYGPDQLAGYPLVCVYLTGRDVKNVFEIDATVSQLMSAAQLYLSGATFTWNPYRMLFNRVTDCGQVLADGSVSAIEDDKLYRVVTGLYCGQMLGAVESKSFGILSVTPRQADGTVIPMDEIESYIVHDANGDEVKEWAAIADYLSTFKEGLDQPYSGELNRKVTVRSLSPAALLKNCNRITFGVICLILAVILLLVLLIRRIARRIRRRKNRPDLRQRGAGDGYSGSRHHSGGGDVADGGFVSHYKGSRKSRGGEVTGGQSPERYTRAFHGEGRYGKKDRHLFWNPAYKGKRGKK